MSLTADRKPVRTFVSYSREDSSHCETLRRHLAGLVNEGFIEFFVDRQIRPGETWEPKLLDELCRAEIVLILVTKNFTSSEYCYKKELPIALRMHWERRTRVIPVLVGHTDLEVLRFKEIQAVPNDWITSGTWDTADRAWTIVAKAVREQATRLRQESRPVSEVLDCVNEVLSSAKTMNFGSSPRRYFAPTEFASISEFWKSVHSRPKGAQMVAKIAGTFSRFAPMMVGPPRVKRRLHHDFRIGLERQKSFGKLKLPTINACMSISAGQMVQLAPTESGEIHYFGLYNSIVRNSIPVLMRADYYQEVVVPLLTQLKRHSFEATVTGRVVHLDNSYLSRLYERNGLDTFTDETVIDDLVKSALALEVAGDGTGIEYQGPPRYLDGDIWLAVENEGLERFITAFVDVADPSDRDEGFAQLVNDLNRLPSARIMARWDDEDCEFRQLFERTLEIGLGDFKEATEQLRQVRPIRSRQKIQV